jgi:hypothetical protein
MTFGKGTQLAFGMLIMVLGGFNLGTWVVSTQKAVTATWNWYPEGTIVISSAALMIAGGVMILTGITAAIASGRSSSA